MNHSTMRVTSILAFGALAVLHSLLGFANITCLAEEETTRELILADKVIRKTELLNLSDQGNVELIANGEKQIRAIDDIARWGTLRTPNRVPVALLNDGSRMVVQGIQKQKDRFAIQSFQWEETFIEEPLLRGLILTTPGSDQRWNQWIERMLTAEGRNDQVAVKDRGWIQGTLVWSEDSFDLVQPSGRLVLRVDGENLELKIEEVEAILFSPVLTPIMSTVASQSIGFKDGSRLYCTQWSIDTNQFARFRLTGGLELKSAVSVSEISSNVCFLAGSSKNFSYLSDIEPASYKHLDFLSTKWELGRDYDLWRRKLKQANGDTNAGEVEKGLAMHATSQVAFRWNKSAGKLLAQVVLAEPEQPSTSSAGSAIAKVLILKEGKLETKLTSDLITLKSQPQEVDVSITGAELVILLVDAGPQGTIGDHVLWLDARIAKE